MPLQTFNMFTNEPDSLPEGKADFLLAVSVSKACEPRDITPILDAEFITNEKLFSLMYPVPTVSELLKPAIFTRAVHNLTPFSCVEILDLGLSVEPQNCSIHHFGIYPSQSIDTRANIDVKKVFTKGMEFGKSYELRGNYLVLAESTSLKNPAASASLLVLGYNFDLTNERKTKTINRALGLINSDMSNFEKLGIVGDNILVFCAGFLFEASKRFQIVLSGTVEMAATLLIADKLREDVLMRVKHDNITFASMQSTSEDENASILQILEQLSYKPHAVYTSTDFAQEKFQMRAGADASLAYAVKNGISDEELLEQIEYLTYSV